MVGVGEDLAKVNSISFSFFSGSFIDSGIKFEFGWTRIVGSDRGTRLMGGFGDLVSWE